MPLPTPSRWSSAAWREDTLAWGRRALSSRGLAVRAWSQPHARPWSTVLRLETDQGPFWLKAPGDGARVEVPLLDLLARLDAPSTPRPLASDHERGLVLLPDGGPIARTAYGGATPPEVMADYLARYGSLQRDLETHVEDLLAIGVVDLRPATMPALFEHTVAVLETERPPGRLSADEAARLRQVLPAYAEACAELAASGIASTVQHDDLHDANILERGPVFIDWGDACVGHPFGTMLATLNSVAHHHGLAPLDPALPRIVDAYTEAWTDVHDRATLRRLVALAQRVGPLTRSLAYRSALTHVDDAAWDEYGEALPGWLLEVFEPDLPLRPPLLG